MSLVELLKNPLISAVISFIVTLGIKAIDHKYRHPEKEFQMVDGVKAGLFVAVLVGVIVFMISVPKEIKEEILTEPFE